MVFRSESCFYHHICLLNTCCTPFRILPPSFLSCFHGTLYFPLPFCLLFCLDIRFLFRGNVNSYLGAPSVHQNDVNLSRNSANPCLYNLDWNNESLCQNNVNPCRDGVSLCQEIGGFLEVPLLPKLLFLSFFFLSFLFFS